MLPAHIGTDNHSVHSSDQYGNGYTNARLYIVPLHFNAEFRYAIMLKDSRR